MSKILVMAMLCLSMNAYSQTTKPLSIGDTVPDLTLNHIINYKTTSVKISDFKNKPVIIDFFSTWCSSCIAALPHLDKLQEKFQDDIKIFVVTSEKQKILKDFLKKNPIAKKINLSFITDDTLLSSLFPHSLIPHEIIIKNNLIKAVTYPEYINQQTVATLLANNSIELPEKRDLINLDLGLPLEENIELENQLLYHSLFTKYLEGFGFKTAIRKNKKTKRLIITNAPIIYLFQLATNITDPAKQNRVILEVNKKERYIAPKSFIKNGEWHSWAIKNNYCYELTAPINTPDSIMRSLMQEDLNRYLGLNGRIERRKVKCHKLVFNNIRDSLLVKSKGKTRIININKSDSIKTIKNYTMTALVDAINSQAIPYPLHPIVIDKTNYKGKIDIELKINDIQDLSALSDEIAKYGLRIVPFECYLDVLVISATNEQKNNS